MEILPHLYLGNAANSEDREALARHRIQYILNVTPDLPNVFESAGSIKYMQIPISDHWSQNLASFFPQAIQFIGEWQHVDFRVSFFSRKIVCELGEIEIHLTRVLLDLIFRFAAFDLPFLGQKSLSSMFTYARKDTASLAKLAA